MIYLYNAENSLEKERKILQNIPSQNIAGVIVTPSTNDHAHIMKLRDFNIPYIYLNRNFTDDKEHCIRIDNRKAAHDAVCYLIENGHRTIGGVFQSFENMSYEERYDGMVLALNEYGLPVNPHHILFNTEVDDLQASVHLRNPGQGAVQGIHQLYRPLHKNRQTHEPSYSERPSGNPGFS